MQNIKLSSEDRKNLNNSLKKVVGQLQAVAQIIENDKVSDATFTQLLAAKGGVTRVCKDIIATGVLKNLKNYDLKELDQALNIIFKLD